MGVLVPCGSEHGVFLREPWDLLEKYGWYVRNSPTRTQPTGRLKPNDFGLFDLHGNIWELCQEPPKEDLLRGGSFFDRPAFVRSTSHYVDEPSYRGTNIGFRPARTYH